MSGGSKNLKKCDGKEITKLLPLGERERNKSISDQGKHMYLGLKSGAF